MANVVRATLSGSDLKGLVQTLLEEMPFAHEEPESLSIKLVDKPTRGWREKLLNPKTSDLLVSWAGDEHFMGREPGAILCTLVVPVDAAAVLKRFSKLPFEVAVLSNIERGWAKAGYRARAPSDGHAQLGWGMLLKGAGHDNAIVSRRWLECGPFRVLKGAEDTTLAQFCDLGVDATTSLAEAKPAHVWMLDGFIAPKHHYEHDIGGIYTKKDGLLRVVVNDRTISVSEMLDACAARRDGKDDPKKPISNVAYVFSDEKQAKAQLEALWLHGLECRVADGRGERRIDDSFKPRIAKPKWAR
jgi:hypothetical protein